MSSERTWERFTLPMGIRGAAIGMLAFTTGLTITNTTAAAAAQQAASTFEPLANAGGRFVPAWKAAGWTFLDAHFVGTAYPGGSVDMVSMASVQYLYLLPVISCLFAGGVLVWLADRRDPRDGVLDGLSLVFGYLPMAIVFAIIFQHANVQPSLLRTVVVAGLVYPILFGGIGGVLAAFLLSNRQTIA